MHFLICNSLYAALLPFLSQTKSVPFLIPKSKWVLQFGFRFLTLFKFYWKIHHRISLPNSIALIILHFFSDQSTLKRRKHLQETKFFSCCCRRCKDPTELRTYAGAMKCSLCRDGLVLPTNPLDNDADWKCISSKCHSERIAVSSIIPFLDRYA